MMKLVEETHSVETPSSRCTEAFQLKERCTGLYLI